MSRYAGYELKSCPPGSAERLIDLDEAIGLGNGDWRNSIALMTLKIAVLAPIPSPRIRTAASGEAPVTDQPSQACRVSRASVSKGDVPRESRRGSLIGSRRILSRDGGGPKKFGCGGR